MALIAALLSILAGCLSIAPIEPIKNPPTKFRSDNVVAVEFLNPAKVGLRCAERGTQAFGIPVFHAMACGNGKLITMPDPCQTFTGGNYASLLCDQRSGPLEPVGDAAFQVEFVHPSAVLQRCSTRGLYVTYSEQSVLASCASTNLMTVPNPCMILETGWYPRTLCHELAHANGWSMNHPGGSFLSDARAGVNKNDVPPPRAVLSILSGSAPLRPASESPAYIAFVADHAPTGLLPEFVNLPGVTEQLPAGADPLFQRVMVPLHQSAPDVQRCIAGDAAASHFNAYASKALELLPTAIIGNALTPRVHLPAVAGTIHLDGTEASGSRALTTAVLHLVPSAAHRQAAVGFAISTREIATRSVARAAKCVAAAIEDDPAVLEAFTAVLAGADNAE